MQKNFQYPDYENAFKNYLQEDLRFLIPSPENIFDIGTPHPAFITEECYSKFTRLYVFFFQIIFTWNSCILGYLYHISLICISIIQESCVKLPLLR